jgi:phosphoglycolate phosphatase-like HAD superfamily hydrolase
VNTVLFDLDDTLLDSFDARVRALHVVFTQAKIAGVTAEGFLNSLQGAQLKAALERLAEAQNVKNDLFINYRRAYWVARPGRIRLYPGVRAMLETLKSRGFRLGIVTNKGRDFEFEGHHVGCMHELKEVGIAELFATVIGFEDVREQKPHPLGINLALHSVGAGPSDALVIGDSVADIEAARAAGCLSCHAAWGIAPDAVNPESLMPDFIATAPEDVISIIAGIT